MLFDILNILRNFKNCRLIETMHDVRYVALSKEINPVHPGESKYTACQRKHDKGRLLMGDMQNEIQTASKTRAQNQLIKYYKKSESVEIESNRNKVRDGLSFCCMIMFKTSAVLYCQ